MTRLPSCLRAPRRAAAALGAATLLLAACGGGSGDAPAVAEAPAADASCSLPDQKAWLASYMDAEYLWYATAPRPDPAASPTLDGYFAALLSPGVAGDPNLPVDRWSYVESTESYAQFFEAGRTLGYGVSVAGFEVAGQPERPLRVRYIEPTSPAAAAGVRRGDTVLAINGTPSSQVIARGDYSALTPAQTGDRLLLQLRDAAGVERIVELVARVYDLTPVSDSRIVASPAGTPIGYVVLKDFISQARAPLEQAFASFQAAGVRELVLDLRYNGGGLVSVAGTLASYAAGAPAANQTFTLLSFNDKRQARNTVFRFSSLASAMGASRVFVLTGQRSCSASELVISGLQPFVQVVQIGDTTCGKPVGFVPVDACGSTFSAVNFESLNAAGQGRYWNGLAPACPLADDLDHALGDADEALLAAARGYVDAGACPAATGRERPMALHGAWRRVDEGERRGMVGR